MEEENEGRRTNEKWGRNQETDPLAAFVIKNNLHLEDLRTLLIQKECELVCLRSELEVHKNCKIQEDDQDESIGEEVGHAIEQIQGFGDAQTESQDMKISFPEMFSVFKKNTFSSICNHETQETEEKFPNEFKKTNIHQVMTKVSNEPIVKSQAQLSEEKLELERQKTILHEKELQIQKERNDLEFLRYQFEEEKKMLEMNKKKIETELRNLLDDDNEWDVKKEGLENWGEQEIISISEITHSEMKDDTTLQSIDDAIVVTEETHNTGNFVPSTEQGDPSQSYEILENVIEMEVNVSYCENLAKVDNELQQLAEAKANKIITEYEVKLSELQHFMDTWKKVAEDEKKLMNYEKENKESVGHQIRESCRIAINNISKEWTEIKEAYGKIQMHQDKLTELEDKILAKKLELDEQENLNKEDFVKIENEKQTIQAEWKSINLEKEQIKNEKISLKRERETLNESRESVERHRQELEKIKAEYREEVRVGEEIRRKVDENRTLGIIEEQRNLEGKRESLMTERHNLYKARQRCDAQQTLLEWERMCVAREKEAVKDQWIILEKEKLALGIVKLTNNENMMMIDNAWKEIQAKECEMEKEVASLEKERKYIIDEKNSLKEERFQVDELKESVLKRVTEINSELGQVEEKKKELLTMTAVTDKKKRELDTEWETLKKEKEECIKIAERNNGISQTLRQDYRLRQCEVIRSIKNRILSLVEEVGCMEERSLDEATNDLCNERFTKQHKFDITYKIQRAKNGIRDDQNHLNQRIQHLVTTVKGMEKDMIKMRSKINRKKRLKNKVTILKKQVKTMQGQISSLQQNLKQRSDMKSDAIGLIKRFMDPYDDSFMRRMDNDNYDSFETMTSRKNAMTGRANKIVEDWKRTYLLQDKYCLKCLRSIQIIKSQNCDFSNDGNIDSRKGEMTHQMRTIRDLEKGQSNFEDMTLLCEEMPHSNIKCLPKTKDKKKGNMNRCKQYKEHQQSPDVIESEIGSASHLFPHPNSPWGIKPQADSSNRRRRERSAWNLAFIIAIIISCGATSVLFSPSLQYNLPLMIDFHRVFNDLKFPRPK